MTSHDFARSIIPKEMGNARISADELPDRLNELSRDKTIVVA